MNQNCYEGQILDEAMLVQRAVGHDTEAFGRLYDMMSTGYMDIEIA